MTLQTSPQIPDDINMKTCPYCGCHTNGSALRCCPAGLAEGELRQKARSYPAVHHELLRLGNIKDPSAMFFLLGVALNSHDFNEGHVKAATHLAGRAHATAPHPDTLGKEWPQGPGHRTDPLAEADIMHVIGHIAAKAAQDKQQQLLRVYQLCLGWLLAQGWPRTRATQQYATSLTEQIQKHGLIRVIEQ